MLKFGKAENLLGLVMQCVIWEFYRLGYKGSNLAVLKPAMSNMPFNTSVYFLCMIY